MARLIDANSILDDFLKRYTEMEKDRKLVFAACEIKQDFADMISKATTVDAVEVVHGRWKKHTVAGEDFFGNPVLKIWACNCSVCGLDGREETPYCPNCGADMRGSNDE